MKNLHGLLVILTFSFYFPSRIESSELIEEIHDYIMKSYNITKYFILYPIFERIHDHYKFISLLPHPSIIHHYDAYGNLLLNSREILKEDESCCRAQNFTETFKNFIDNLGVKKGATFTRIEFTKHNSKEYDLTASTTTSTPDYWEYYYLNRHQMNFYINETVDIDISMLQKTFKTFPLLEIPLRKRFAIILEVYLIDLIKSFYPSITGIKLAKFEDLLGILLF